MSDKTLAAILDDAPVSIAVHDLQHNIRWANRAYREATGRTLEENEGAKCYSRWGLREPCRGCLVLSVTETGEPAEADLTPENQDHWPASHGSWLAKATPLRDAEGTLVGAIEWTFDITERRVGEKAQRQSDAYSESVVENLSSGVAVYEPVNDGEDFVFKAFNRAAEVIEAIGRDRVIGRRVTEVFPGVRDFGLLDVFRRVHETGEPESFPVALYSDERITGWRQNFVYKLSTGEIVATYDDLTESKQIEAELQETKAFFETVIEQSPFAMWVSDPEGTIIQTNGALRAALQLTDEQMVGNYNVLEDENLRDQGVLPMVRAVFEQHEQATFSIFWKARSAGDGEFAGASDLHIDVSMLPIIGSRGELKHVVCQWIDVTERVNAEQQLRELTRTLELRVQDRTAALEATNSELESFAYSVSHDLRAPLRAISGFAHIITRRHLKDLGEEGQHYFDNIVRAAEHMGRLIDDLLRYGRLGQTGVSLSPVQPGQLFDTVLDTLSESIRRSGARVEVAVDLPVVLADKTLLGQLFVNLVENALEYQPPGATPEIRVTWSTVDERVLLHIADNGIGIDPRFHEKIFRPFQRLHPANVYPGTGIGLAIVAKAAALMAGRVWVDSKPGGGSTFHVDLAPARAVSGEECSSHE